MLEPGGWVNVALPKGVLRAQLVEIQGDRCCCVFEDGKKAWVATSTVTSLGARPSGPGPTVSRPPSPASARSISNRWRAALIVGVGVVVVTGAALFALSKRRPAPTPAASAAAVLSDPIPAQLRHVVSGISLPLVEDGLDFDLKDATNVAIDRRAVYVENERVAELEPIRVADRPQRVDPLFERLKATREVWKTAHVGAEFPGLVQLWVHEETSAQVLKAVFQTAAFAGYPNGSLVLRRRSAPRELQRVNIDASVPGPPSDTPEPSKIVRMLGVVLRADEQIELAWVGAGLEPPIERTVPSASLGASIVQLWNERPPGVDLIPERWEQAALSVPNTVPFRKVAQVLDGLGAARVKLAVTQYQEAWTFEVTLKLKVAESARKLAEEELSPRELPHATVGAPMTGGGLSQEAVQKTMKASIGKFSGCFQRAQSKKPALSGTLKLFFVIELDGRVDNARLDATPTIHDAELERCTLNVLEQLTFPGSSGRPTSVAFPLTYTPPHR